jgi:hypothetical protein
MFFGGMQGWRFYANNRSLTKKPGIQPGSCETSHRSVALVTVGQVAAYAAAQCATQACTDGRTGLAAQAVADHRTTRSAHTTADGRTGTVAFLGSHGTARCACHTGTDGCTGAAAHALAYDVTQRTAQTATDGGSAVTSHCTLSNQKTQNHSRQCETHDKNLKK